MQKQMLAMETARSLTETALHKAQAILSSECSPIGLMASPEGYPHVWARDSVITSLGALLSPGHETCLPVVSLRTLASQQSELGAIPNNVSVATGRLDHTNAGSMDSNLWFILGHAFQYRVSGDAAFLQAQWPVLEKALLWLRGAGSERGWEFNVAYGPAVLGPRRGWVASNRGRA
jgi:glycogen debranching enzyme